MSKSVRLYIDDVFICTVPMYRLEGTIRALHKAGKHNVKIRDSEE